MSAELFFSFFLVIYIIYLISEAFRTTFMGTFFFLSILISSYPIGLAISNFFFGQKSPEILNTIIIIVTYTAFYFLFITLKKGKLEIEGEYK